MADRLYLDNAATTFPKPPEVLDAMARYATELGASPGRGSYRESIDGARLIQSCRDRLAGLLGLSSPEHAILTLNTSDALNLAIHGLVAQRRREMPDDPIHLVTSRMDHNSVLRPFNALAADPVGAPVEVSFVDVDPSTGLIDPAAFRAALRPSTLLAATVHASNVSGTLQPIAEIGAVCRDAGVPQLVDAAQSAGRVPVDLEAMGIDLLAVPGHKALMGPLGTAALLIRPGLEDRILAVRQGGTGSVSESDTQPETLPDKYEPGSHNTIGIAGLEAALRWLSEYSVERVRAEEGELIARTLAALDDEERYPGLRLIGPRDAERRVGVFSFVHDAVGPQEIATILETEFGILTRAGIHCAPHAHNTFETTAGGGAVRLSYGPFTTVDDVDRALGALSEICRSMAPA